MTRLIEDLDALHDDYVEAVNLAVAADDLRLAETLAASYDEEAIRLVAEREGRTDLLPLRRPAGSDSRLWRLLRRAA